MEKIILDIPNGYEFFGINDDNKVVLTKKQPQYPKDYRECCDVLGFRLGDNIDNLEGYKSNLLEQLQILLICRDAYLKIAGEEMGLGEPWEPDWCSELDLNYTIIYNGMYTNKIDGTGRYALLAFPTKEMRDAFYENFNDLIEECKELL